MTEPFIGALVAETIFLDRAQRCDHDWKPLNEREDQCSKCTIIATSEGKKWLAEARRRRFGT